ncbi:PRD domain-containing protein [Amphibacillus sp. MSJ-3]|uniref:PRD domain-containing protein n=1 Tax=Amphibacillus sp. MSJ-3 TaxID=2841505 RepID=UPI001C0E9AF0|nr:PRD domain-containing protein [Amphibacillus sp. MSJ-3]MBU5594309.1 PRD domain-containing protein [Amphibacillus sp. MSJ-3]
MGMRIIRIFNNSVVLVEDQNKDKKIVLGKGVGFHAKVNDKLDEAKVEQVFVLEDASQEKKLKHMTKFASIEYVDLTRKIIDQAEQDLGVTFNDSVFIGLLDHISYALQRTSQSGHLKNALIWEIKKFYKAEFQAALTALKLIEAEEKVQLSEDEAGFIAMHFVNGQQSNVAKKTPMHDAEVIQDILNIIKFHFKMEVDETTVNFSRFIIHMRYFLQRIHDPSERRNTIEPELFIQVYEKYPDTYKCVEKIAVYLKKKLNVTITKEEMFYLMLHINRLTLREKTYFD